VGSGAAVTAAGGWDTLDDGGAAVGSGVTEAGAETGAEAPIDGATLASAESSPVTVTHALAITLSASKAARPGACLARRPQREGFDRTASPSPHGRPR
jgi:hypothetical protein